MAEYIAPIKRLIEEIRRLPGVGNKTAARYAFAMLEFKDEELLHFAEAVNALRTDVHRCPVCHNLSESADLCSICKSEDRDNGIICVVENSKDVMVMEQVRSYRGLYHVLGGELSPIDNVTAEDLNIPSLVKRVTEGEVSEVIIACNPTPGGDTTAAYIARLLEPYGVTVSRLAYGIPVGGDIEYADAVTLARAMEGRRNYK